MSGRTNYKRAARIAPAVVAMVMTVAWLAAGCASDSALDGYKAQVSTMLSELGSANELAGASAMDSFGQAAHTAAERAAQATLLREGLEGMAANVSDTRIGIRGLEVPPQAQAFSDQLSGYLDDATSSIESFEASADYLVGFYSAYAEFDPVSERVGIELTTAVNSSSPDVASVLDSLESWTVAMSTLQTRLRGLGPTEAVADQQAVLVTQLGRTIEEIEMAADRLSQAAASGSFNLQSSWSTLMAEAIEQCSLLDQAYVDLLDAGRSALDRLIESVIGTEDQFRDLQSALERL